MLNALDHPACAEEGKGLALGYQGLQMLWPDALGTAGAGSVAIDICIAARGKLLFQPSARSFSVTTGNSSQGLKLQVPSKYRTMRECVLMSSFD